MKILVPLDGSDLSDAVLQPVARLAHPLGATVELLMVALPAGMRQTPATEAFHDTIPAATLSGTRLNIPLLDAVLPPPAENREQAVERVEAEARGYLHARAQQLAGIDTTIAVVIAEHPADAIIAHAKNRQVDLIAMATHGRTGLSHLLAGSVTECVIRSGIAPVMVVRPVSG